MKKRLKKLLSRILPSEESECASNSYDIVGNIAIVRLTEKSEKYRKEIADAIMEIHKNVKTVLAQTSPVDGEFRTRALKCIGGEARSLTIHVESKCKFLVDLEKCYFSPRFSHERMRVARQVANGEIVVNMFAGVGCFSFLIAKHSKPSKVYSIDVNPAAVQFMRENVRLNGAYGVVVPMIGDSKNIIEKGLQGIADRVLMPLPEKAFEYLPVALSTLKKTGGLVHYYDFEHAKREDPVEKTRAKVAGKLDCMNTVIEFPYGGVVRSTGPNWYQVVLDILIRH